VTPLTVRTVLNTADSHADLEDLGLATSLRVLNVFVTSRCQTSTSRLVDNIPKFIRTKAVHIEV